MLKVAPPVGISYWPVEDRVDLLEAQLIGGIGTLYEGGVFKLEVSIPESLVKCPGARLIL